LIFKDVKCPVVWDCFSTGERTTVELYAIYNIEKGWLCSCGKWVKENDSVHDIVLYGIREACIGEKDDYVNLQILPDRTITRCCECGKLTDRCVLGVYVCRDCYDYDLNAKQGFNTAFGELILECGIEFNPESLICKNCKHFRDCSVHYVIIKDDEIRKDVPLF
jgi:hypothetical protein